jgi:hypothetical protein
LFEKKLNSRFLGKKMMREKIGNIRIWNGDTYFLRGMEVEPAFGRRVI